MTRDRDLLLIVDNYFPRLGGAEAVYRRLASGMIERGWRVTVWTTRVSGRHDRETMEGVQIHRLASNRYLFLFAVPWYWWRHRREARFDLIQTATYSSAIPAWLVAQLTGVPVVLLVHEILGKIWQKGMSGLQGTVHLLLEKLVLGFRFSHYVAVSEHTASQLIRAGKLQARIKAIANGVDRLKADQPSDETRQQFGLPTKDHLFLYYGRLGISKGLDTLQRAAECLLVESLPCQVVFVVAEKAHDDLYQGLESLRNRFQDRVTLLHSLDRQSLVNLIDAADTVVVPSYSEGFGLSAIEACQLGKPLIASDIPVFREYLWGPVRLVPPGEAGALEMAMRDRLAGKDIEIKPKRHEFAWDTMVDAYQCLYEELV